MKIVRTQKVKAYIFQPALDGKEPKHKWQMLNYTEKQWVYWHSID